jgi:hypothetical protein
MANRAGFVQFIRAAGIDSASLPDASTYIDAALALSIEIVYEPMASASPLMYDQAVYNLGMSTLVETAPDQTNKTTFFDLRKSFNINGFVPGVVQSSGDEGTYSSMLVPDFFKNLTFADLQYIKTPWGRAYMAIAQRVGSLWGVS